MTTKTLFIRFLKENSIYGGDTSKCLLSYFDRGEEMKPFNAFVWSGTVQGHNYWYEKQLGWVIFLYYNFNYLDAKIEKSKILNTLDSLIRCYYKSTDTEEDKQKIPTYNVAKEILKNNNRKRLQFKIDELFC